MLDSLRKSGASVAIYLIFGLLIVIFVINFAPNAGQSPGGCMGSGTTPLTIDGERNLRAAGDYSGPAGPAWWGVRNP